MKVAVTFFRNKRKKDYKRINDIQKKYVNINTFDSIEIKKYEILMVLFVSIFIVLNSSELVYLGSNISHIDNIDISKEEIVSLNALANVNNYIFSKEEENQETEEVITDEELAMDQMVDNYTDIMAFNIVSKEDIQVISENNTYQKLNVCGVDITNYSTNRNIDFEKILNSNDKYFSKSSDDILLYTTHTSESYANSEGYKFDYTSPRRTTDGQYNMLSIASTFASNLNNKGINTICSLTPHDYGEYNSAYSNSRRTVETLVYANPNASILIDVHRDAIEDLDFAPKTELRGYKVASLMLVMGIGYDDGYNPYYEQNLKLALEIQILANKIYPGLFRPMIIRNSIYNQDIKESSFLVEVGASGNTIEEAKLATRCLANLLNILYRD
ncbi:MAG: stage II sporulation protein P [Clostridia bacterium]